MYDFRKHKDLVRVEVPKLHKPTTKKEKIAFARNTLEGLVLCAAFMPFFMWGTIHVALRIIIGVVVVGLLLFTPNLRPILCPALPVLAWLTLFTSCGGIPTDIRPVINVTSLPDIESAIFGGNLSDKLASNTSPVKDIFAWIPYGVLHFVNGVIAIPVFYFLGPKGTLPRFARAYGYMNLAGVVTQIAFPTASPWYFYLFGTQPADYSMPGNPGGLARVDGILHINLYGNTFGNSPLVFGAWPSLHSASAVLINLFIARINPWMIPLNFGYVFWIWWACLYLRHHYLVDLFGGLIYALIAFIWIYHGHILPERNSKKNYCSLPFSMSDLSDNAQQEKDDTPPMVVVRT